MGKNTLDIDKSKFVRLERATVEEISYFLFALGNQFVSAKNAEGAFDCFKYSIDLNPKHQPSVYNLGALYNLMGNMEGSYRMFAESVRMKPDDLVARTALGEVSRKLGKLDEARAILDDVYKRDPDNYVVMSAIAVLNYDCGRLAEARAWNERALEKKPNDLYMLLNKALINMTFGNWADWWAQYEFCLSYQKNERMRGMNIAEAWNGREMPGKTLLVISDQGSGDAIQFSRYLKEARAKGNFGRICYMVQPDLVDLLKRVEGIDDVFGFGERSKLDFDTFSSLLGIMRVLRVSPDNCARPPHITTSPELDELWKHRVDAAWDGQSMKVGIVWAGDPKHGNDHARSLPLYQFAKIVRGTPQVPACIDVQLFSFQVGPGSRQLSSDPTGEFSTIVDLAQDFRSFDDTASALAQMDLLISCDTSVAHLAGCMGVPTWVLLPNPPEWRWLTDVGTAPWYSSVKLYRESKPRDWDSVILAVLSDLHELLSRKEVMP
jgi:Tfp pilus assembly protein PilF